MGYNIIETNADSLQNNFQRKFSQNLYDFVLGNVVEIVVYKFSSSSGEELTISPSPAYESVH